MTHRTRTKLALAGALAALLIGCGGDDEGRPIPADIREQLERRLAEAERRLNDGSAGACNDITNDTQVSVSQTLESVPGDVDADVRQALDDGFARLFELTSERCDELERQESETDTETTETTPPPEETTTTEEETTPTTPTEEEPQPTEPDPKPEKPEKDKGGGNDDGGGNGVGGELPVPGGGNGGATPPGQG
jgi:hypothetical protein